jgi:hypothetical protein
MTTTSTRAPTTTKTTRAPTKTTTTRAPMTTTTTIAPATTTTVDAQCPAGSTNNFRGVRTSYCYLYLKGATESYTEADRRCRELGYPLVTPKTDAGLNDLSVLTNGFRSKVFWVNYKKFIVHLR